jgi:hypothetical protein
LVFLVPVRSQESDYQTAFPFADLANDFVMGAGFAARPSKAWLAISPKKNMQSFPAFVDYGIR